jgi:membrane associated rhomboid family serine protease
MLKFREKKKVFFPKFSILIWLVSFAAIILTEYYREKFNLHQIFAIVPSELADNIRQSWFYILKLISALFLHGNWQHWAGNMIPFLIIALPLEKKLGGYWFVLIFFVSGFAANISSIYQLSESNNYLIGASGAVSGLLGAWLLLFPRQRISVIIPIGFYLQKIKIPILLLALIWLSIQIILQLNSQLDFPIVWLSHIVGFIIGFLVAWLYRVTT